MNIGRTVRVWVTLACIGGIILILLPHIVSG